MKGKSICMLELSAEHDASHADQQPPELPDPISVAKAVLQQMPCDFFVYSGGIHPGHEADLAARLDDVQAPAKEVILWLTTPGGDPNAAYSMSRMLQRKYEKLTIFVNGWCKSSGTLMCLGATRLVMGDLGQLGPLDIQILNREEFGERHSGLNPVEALKALSYQSMELLREQFLDIRFGGGLSTKQALEVATNLTGQLMSPITSQLDIMKFGEFTRSMRIATEYGNRLAKYQEHKNVKPRAIDLLTTGYPSHGFVIDREEAAEKLFVNVDPPSEELLIISRCLQHAVDKPMRNINNPSLLIDLRQALGVSFLAEAAQESEADESVQPQDDGNSTAEEGPNDVAQL